MLKSSRASRVFQVAAGILLLAGFLPAQTLDANAPLDRGYLEMYNLRFTEAHEAFAEYQRDHPADPLGAVSDAAAYLFSEFQKLNILRTDFALHDQNFFSSPKALPADPEVKKNFEAALAKAKDLAEPGLHQSPPDPGSMFATTLRLGLHSDYLALIEKRSLPALAEIKQAREEADRLLANHPAYYDAYIATAVENYLLSLKPAPVRWFLHITGAQTDRKRGLDELHITADKGHYLRPYARLLLAVAALRDNEPESAKEGLQWLASEFPGNPLYLEELKKID